MHNPPGLIIVLVLKDVCYLYRIEIEDVITNMPAVPACMEKGSKFSQMLTVRQGGVTPPPTLTASLTVRG